ncbi:MAG TPA: hypothetical protein VM942_02835 [Acidimicrobiales bacterium]|nr:hypothetical protein [Acidimicrobiales bacterium]
MISEDGFEGISAEAVEGIVLVRSKQLGRSEEDAHTSPRPPSRQVRETVSSA